MATKIPPLEDPQKYVDLFVVDLGDRGLGVGYTADEVAALIEQEAYADAKVFRIHDASPEGQVKLVGVPRERFGLEAGIFFGQEVESAARADYEGLLSLLRKHPPPTRLRLVLGHCRDWRAPYQTGMVYPAECDNAVSRYLLEHEYRGGINATGGVGIVTEFNAVVRVIDSEGFQAAADRRGRDWDQLRAAVGETIQR
jgi:hypothetical protein